VRAGVGIQASRDNDGKETLTPVIRLHDLRHSCASFLLAQGVPARVVMEILGHSGISVTMDTYSHVLPTLLRESVERIDELFGDDQ
jgi:integrase